MRPIIASLIFAMPAHAGDSAFWGTTGCTLVPTHGETWVAELRCVNHLTSMTPADVSADLQVGDLTVRLDLSQTSGKTPDIFTVTPPDGFVADPPIMSLDEDAVGVARVFHFLGY